LANTVRLNRSNLVTRTLPRLRAPGVDDFYLRFHGNGSDFFTFSHNYSSRLRTTCVNAALIPMRSASASNA
jgi:hypothetical protein